MHTGTSERDDSVVYHCGRCGRQNRIPGSRVLDDPTCGACKAKIFPRAPVTVTTATWRREVEDCPIPVLVDMWAPWCGPCRAVAPVLEQVAAERAGRLKVVKLNVDENPDLAARFGVRSIPTLLVMRGAQAVDQIVGALPKPALDARLQRLI